MSRYLILVLLNTPLVTAAIISTIVSYKLGHISFRKLMLKTTLWISVLLGLIFAESIYTYLYNEGLTETEPLSLFDVIQLTAVVYILYLVSRLYAKLSILERRLIDLHQETSIILSRQTNSRSRFKK